MELVKVLRELSRQWKLVGLVLAVSLAVGFFLAFRPAIPPHSRQYQVSLSSSEILFDTRDSQVATVGGRGPELATLASRANLLGNLMTGGPLKDAIAKTAGVPSDKLDVVPPVNPNTPEVVPVPVEPPAAQGIPDSEATILSLSTDENLPILHVVAQAPDAETARKLSGGVIVALRGYLGLGSIAASQTTPAAHQLVVRQFGAPRAGTATRGLPRSLALVATIVLALLGCGAIVGGSWFIRSWKRIGEAEGVEPSVGEAGEPSVHSVAPAALTVAPEALSADPPAVGENGPAPAPAYDDEAEAKSSDWPEPTKKKGSSGVSVGEVSA